MDQATREGRREYRKAASLRFAGNLMTIGEFLSWAGQNLKHGARQGRITCDLILTTEAFDALPGDAVEKFVNSNNETFYRKKVSVPGAVTLDLRVMMFGEGENEEEPAAKTPGQP